MQIESSKPPSFSLRDILANNKMGELTFTLIISIFLAIWHSMVNRSFSIPVFGGFLFLSGISMIYGRLFICLASRWTGINPTLPLQFLGGYFAVNTLCFILSVLSHFSIITNGIIVAAAGLLTLAIPCGNIQQTKAPIDLFAELFCVLLGGIAATLWCADSLHPIIRHGALAMFRTWPDSFFHACQITAFSHAHGLGTISHVQMAGAPASVYHYAIYVMPAAIKAFTGSGSYETFASFMTPFGILLTGLAAFSLASSIWSAWPGIAAMAAVLLIPDAYQQGFQNKFMGYNFLQQVNPGGLYGVTVAAMAWLFILHGCKSGKKAAIFLGYALTAVSIVYKAQIFVANAYLVMIYPCLFFPAVRAKWRVAAGVCLTALFVFVVHLSASSSAIPTLRLNAAFCKNYAYLLLISFDVGKLRQLFYLQLAEQPPFLFDLNLGAMILVLTFGLWLPACIAAFFLVRPKPDRAARFFPLLVVLNYIVMAVGLDGDAKKVGMPEELIHRPLVWAYFVVAAWTGGALHSYIFAGRKWKIPYPQVITAAAVVLALAVPVMYCRKLQTMGAWGTDYNTFALYPSALVDAATYVRTHGNPHDVVQTSDNDPTLLFSAISERQEFVAYSNNANSQVRLPEGLQKRAVTVDDFKKASDSMAIVDFAKKNGISWYLLAPNGGTSWPDSFLHTAVFEGGGYKLFRFDQ